VFNKLEPSTVASKSITGTGTTDRLLLQLVSPLSNENKLSLLLQGSSLE